MIIDLNYVYNNCDLKNSNNTSTENEKLSKYMFDNLYELCLKQEFVQVDEIISKIQIEKMPISILCKLVELFNMYASNLKDHPGLRFYDYFYDGVFNCIEFRDKNKLKDLEESLHILDYYEDNYIDYGEYPLEVGP